MALRRRGQRARQPPAQARAARRVRAGPVDRRSRRALRRRSRAGRGVRPLGENDREAICLVAWEGLSIADAARAAGCSTATFHVRLSRARARLARAAREPPRTWRGSHGPCDGTRPRRGPRVGRGVRRPGRLRRARPDAAAALQAPLAVAARRGRRRRRVDRRPDGRAGGERGAAARGAGDGRSVGLDPLRQVARLGQQHRLRRAPGVGVRRQADALARGRQRRGLRRGQGDHAPAEGQGRDGAGHADGPERDLPRGRAAGGGRVGQGRRALERTATPTSCAGASSPGRRTGPRSR